MPAFASVTLTDAAAANVVFAPLSLDQNGVGRLAGTASHSASAASVSGFAAKRQFTTSVSLPKNGSKVVRVKQKVSIPQFNAASGLKTGDVIANLEFVIPADADATDIADVLAHSASLLGNALTDAAVNDFENVY